MGNSKNIPWTDWLYEELQDPKFAAEYLEGALENYERKSFLLTLRHILRAREITITEFAQQTGVSREHLHRMLSLKGNPTFTNILALLDALDFEIAIRPKEKSKTKRKTSSKKRQRQATSPKRKSSRPSSSI